MSDLNPIRDVRVDNVKERVRTGIAQFCRMKMNLPTDMIGNSPTCQSSMVSF